MSLYPFPEQARLESTRQTVPHVARLCGVSKYRVERWIADGLSWVEADLLACRHGVTPAVWWPEWDMPYMSWRRVETWDEALTLRELVAA